MTKPAVMIGLGEVLWDILPSGRVLGGAPGNFAYMTNVLGDEGIVASRVGNDALGMEACHLMQKIGLNTAYLQHDDNYETGTASVHIDNGGQPTFTIKEQVAWDFLEWTPQWEELAARADVICFGSLAQRSPLSTVTIEQFLQRAPERVFRIFDVNLRQTYYNAHVLQKSFKSAHIAKLNDQELIRVSSLLELGSGTHETLAQRLLAKFDLLLVCVTRGEQGSILVSGTETVEHHGFRVKVRDAIGAGDAFTACLAHYYLQGEALKNISEFANRFASWVATQRGATPWVPKTQLRDILNGVSC